MQKTVGSVVRFKGEGLHSGRSVELVVRPAPENHGIVFRRVDLPEPNRIPARFDQVTDLVLNTSLGQGELSVSTIEHLMAAFAGLGLTNLLVDVNAREIPIMDGSAKEFTERLWSAGIYSQDAFATLYYVRKPVEVVMDNGARASLSPDPNFRISFEIDFPNTLITKQSLSLNMGNGVFLRELANSRTFCLDTQIDILRTHGLAKGGSVDNAVIYGKDQVQNPGGLRHEDEAVRHKMLDALGDLYLAGGFIIGHYEGVRAGHRLTNMLLRKAFSENAFERIKATPPVLAKLPGYDILLSDFVH